VFCLLIKTSVYSSTQEYIYTSFLLKVRIKNNLNSFNAFLVVRNLLYQLYQGINTYKKLIISNTFIDLSSFWFESKASNMIYYFNFKKYSIISLIYKIYYLLFCSENPVISSSPKCVLILFLNFLTKRLLLAFLPKTDHLP